VACLEGIKNPAQVALLVLKTTDHILLVGEGAKCFALRHGFVEENLLTEESRRAWLRWKASLSPNDDWLDPSQMDFGAEPRTGALAPSEGADLHAFYQSLPIPYTTGTINCSAVNGQFNLASCTTPSGLSWKIPGRVGDSPIVGAGMYVDNEVGAAGSTGRGEAVIANCASFNIVREMESGKTPTEACLAVLQRIANKTLERRNRDERGRPNFNVSFYAVRKDGAYGSACMLPGGSFAVHDGSENRTWPCPSLLD
jgi:N4-(beta-N-acetylglucosaminyl)-L-asparaginase